MGTFSALLALCAGNSLVTGEFPHKGQWRGTLMFSLICAWINRWVNSREAVDLRRHRAHYDVSVIVIGGIVMLQTAPITRFMGRTWGPSRADRTQVGPMLAPWTLPSGSAWCYEMLSTVIWYSLFDANNYIGVWKVSEVIRTINVSLIVWLRLGTWRNNLTVDRWCLQISICFIPHMPATY